MSKFNVVNKRKLGPVGPIATAGPATTTHEGGPALQRDAKSDLFLLAVANMVGEDTFYESAKDRDNRYASLVHQVAFADPAWLVGFVGWLRREANMRSASLVAAAEAVHARVSCGMNGHNRALVDAALNRADEPGEFLAYWRSRFGRATPMPVKRGLADAAVRLYNERSTLKYDTPSAAVRFGDVLEVAHPKTAKAWQNALFEHLLARRRDRDEQFRGGSLPVLKTRRMLMATPVEERRALLNQDLMNVGGMTWEALSAWLDGTPGGMNAQAWEAVIPSMGLMALARNLRNFDQAGVSDETAKSICERFADPEQVARSRMFPYRWLAAFDAAPSLRWAHALDTALGHAVSRIPELPGRTLVLVDTSASMTNLGFSKRSKMAPAAAAAIFGCALAIRNDVDLVGFADWTFTHTVVREGSLIREAERFMVRTGEVGHGTNISAAMQRYAGHDRVFLISDMQTRGDAGLRIVPANRPVYGVNLGGYAPTVIPSGNQALRYEFGGLNDAMFRMVPLLERGASQTWPWLTANPDENSGGR